MTIPMVDLRPMLAATEPAWRANLERLFERMQFILGEQVEAFERELAAAWGARFAVTVARARRPSSWVCGRRTGRERRGGGRARAHLAVHRAGHPGGRMPAAIRRR